MLNAYLSLFDSIGQHPQLQLVFVNKTKLTLKGSIVTDQGSYVSTRWVLLLSLLPSPVCKNGDYKVIQII